MRRKHVAVFICAVVVLSVTALALNGDGLAMEPNAPLKKESSGGYADTAKAASIKRLVSVIASKDASSAQKAEASNGLVRLGNPAVHSLLVVLSSPDVANSRFYALFALGCLRSPESVEPICRLLGDRSYGPRRYAAIALGQIGSPQAVDALDKALGDVPYVRDDAVDALVKIDSPKARKTLEGYYFSGSDTGFRLSISCVPQAVKMSDAVEIRAALTNLSQHDAVLRLYDGELRCTIVIRRNDGAFVISEVVAVDDRGPARAESRVLKPGDKYRWTLAGRAKRLELPADACATTPSRTTSNALLFGNRAFLPVPHGELRVRLITHIATTGDRASSENQLDTKVVSGEAPLSTL